MRAVPERRDIQAPTPQRDVFLPNMPFAPRRDWNSPFTGADHSMVSLQRDKVRKANMKKKTSQERLVEHLGGALSGHGASKDHPQTQSLMHRIFGNEPEHDQLKSLYFGTGRVDDPARHPERIHLPHL